MPDGIEENPAVLVRLVVGHGRPEGDRLCGSRIEVAELEVEVHHRVLLAPGRQPHGDFIVGRLLEHQENGAFGRS